MKWNEIVIETNTFGSEIVSNIIAEEGSDVSIFDANDFESLIKDKNNAVIWDYYDDNLKKIDDLVYCKGYFDDASYKKAFSNIKSRLENLKNDFDFDIGSLKINTNVIDEMDWSNEWKKYYHSMQVGSFQVVPSWEKPSFNSNHEIYINPGMAFGTGEHESTQICLSLLSEISFLDKVVIDMGTGSGILGIAAAKSNAKNVYLYDIDQAAIDNAKENILLNDVQNNTLAEVSSNLDKNIKDIDVVIANITADILISLKDDFYRVLKKKGYIILSGIINSRYDDVKTEFEKIGFIEDKKIVLGEWSGVRYVKNGN